GREPRRQCPGGLHHGRASGARFLTRSDLMRSVCLVFLLCVLAAPARGQIKVVTTIPELAHAARAIGGEAVEAMALLSGRENPHYVDAVPSFVHAVSGADVVCLIGLGLEVGWLPKVLERSANAKVQPGGAGHCEAGAGVSVLEKPSMPVD